jgi:UPF0755 protein
MRRWLALLVSITVAFIVVSINVYYFANSPLRLGSKQVVFELKPTESLSDLSRELAQKGVIRHPYWLIIYGYVTGAKDRLKPGEYAIERGMTPVQLLERIQKAQVVQHTFILIPGWNFRQIRNNLAHHTKLDHQIKGLSDAEVMQALVASSSSAPLPASPEGQLYPDTYFYTAHTSDLQILKQAYAAMQERMAIAWDARAPDLPYTSPLQALVVASLIEKETHLRSERPLVADIILKRWQAGMRLQIDPTVIYAVGPAFKGQLSKTDLRIDSPYNTYRYKGLPPGPIAIPSMEAIQAALQPQSTPYWYFVVNGNGGHRFSESYAKHIAAIQSHQLSRIGVRMCYANRSLHQLYCLLQEPKACPVCLLPSKGLKG